MKDLGEYVKGLEGRLQDLEKKYIDLEKYVLSIDDRLAYEETGEDY